MRRSSFMLRLYLARRGPVSAVAAAVAAATAAAAAVAAPGSWPRRRPAIGAVSTGSAESSNDPRACEKPLVLETENDDFGSGEAKCGDGTLAAVTGRDRFDVGL